MGRIVVAVSVSVDGMFEGVDHDLSWHMVDDELHTRFNEVCFASGAYLDGRRTHEMMRDFWPTADEDPDNPEVMRAYATHWKVAKKYVLSTTLPDTGEWNTTVLRSFDATGIRALADSLDGDLLVGGGQVVDTVRRHGLVDEWQIYVHPLVLGAGTPFFAPGGGPLAVELAETRTFGNGVVLLRYTTP